MQSGWTKFQFQKRIEELEEELIDEKMVKKNEKQYNEQLRVEIEKRDLHIQALNKINDHFSDIIAKLRKKLKDSTTETQRAQSCSVLID